MSLIVANQCALKTSRFPVLWLFSLSLSFFLRAVCLIVWVFPLSRRRFQHLFCYEAHKLPREKHIGCSSSFFFFFTLAKMRRSPNCSKLLQQPLSHKLSNNNARHAPTEFHAPKAPEFKLVLQCKIYIYIFFCGSDFFAGMDNLWGKCENEEESKGSIVFFLSFPSFLCYAIRFAPPGNESRIKLVLTANDNFAQGKKNECLLRFSCP